MAGYIPINIPERRDGGPFDADFFKRKFHSFIRRACGKDELTTVLELCLITGQVLDVSHFEDFDEDYMLVCCFVDERNCETVYYTYIQYDAIFRVNVFEHSQVERPIGFNYLAFDQKHAADPAKEDSTLSRLTHGGRKKENA